MTLCILLLSEVVEFAGCARVLTQNNSVPDSAPECSEYCSSNCQLSYVANSDYGYSCNATMATLSL